MLKNIITFAFPVHDLTIARYLAAKDINFIGIPSGQAELIHIFKEWLEGPEYITLEPNINQDIPSEYSAYLSNDIITLNNNHFDFFYQVPGDNTLLYTPASNAKYIVCDKLPEIDLPDDIKSRLLIKYSNPQQMKYINQIAGFWINPGMESEIGMADFEKLEELFELIEDLRT